MKKVLGFLVLTVALLLCLASCMHEHSFDEWTVTKNATCTKDGLRCKICTDCGKVFDEEVVEAKGHTESKYWITVEKATCTNQGVETRNCKDCGIVLDTRYTDMLAHNNATKYENVVNATCTEDGSQETVVYCKVCGHESSRDYDILPAKGHDKRTYSEKDENCFAYNFTVCDREGCDFTDFVITGVANHAFSDWERVDDNTTGSPCGIDKIYKRTCADCGVTEDRVDPTPDHNYIVTVISTHGFNSLLGEATIGKIEYVCQNTGCDSVYYEYEYHQYTQTVIAPTCTEQGYTLNSCACGLCYQSDFTDKVPHTPGAEATCTTAQTCTKCLEILTPALDHVWKEATCTDPKICQRADCGATVGKAKGHNFSEWVTVTEPTTTEEGLKERTCSCGEKETESIPALYSMGLKYELNSDEESYSVTGRGNCTDKDIVIPRTHNGLPVTSIGDYAFDYCTSLTSVVIPDSVTSIGEWAFYNCDSLTSIVIPDSVTSIGDFAFCDCTSLTSVVIGDSVTTIGDYAFYWCTSLTSVVIPDSVTTIGNYAFFECSSLATIVIPDSVTSIGDWAFSGCTSLTTIEFKGTVEQWNAIKKGGNWNYYVSATYVQCSDGKVSLN